MGGQACVFYGAAEFSRDIDFAILADSANLDRLRKALAELQADQIAVPPFTLENLRRGHAIHFRSQHPEAFRMRVDLMSKMRGVDPFPKLWKRRTTIELPDGTKCDLLSVADLVRAKKTQRDKDWPMIRRLVESNYFEHRDKPTRSQINFWLAELRTPEVLASVARSHPEACRKMTGSRPLLQIAATGMIEELELALRAEESEERSLDRQHWLPLRAELQSFRHSLISGQED